MKFLRSVAQCLNSIGSLYFDNKQNYLALEYKFKALKIAKTKWNNKLIGGIYNNIGLIYDEINNNELALDYFNKSLEVFVNIFGENHSSVANNYQNIGTMYKEQKNYELAIEFFLKSLKIKEIIFVDNNVNYAGNYINLGYSYFYLSKFELSYQSLTKGVTLLESSNKNNETFLINGYFGLNKLFLKQKNIDSALIYLDKVQYRCLKHNKLTPTLKLSDYWNWSDLIESYYRKAQIFTNYYTDLDFEKEEGLNIAFLHYQACDTLINQARQEITLQSDKLSLAEKASEVYQGAISLCFKMSDDNYYKEQAFYFSEKDKTRILLDEIAEKNAMQKSNIPDSLIEKENDLRFYVSFYRNKLAEQLDSTEIEKYNEKLFETSRNHEALIEQLKQDYPKFAKLKYNHEVPPVADIQSILEPNTAIRSYTVTDSLIYIFTITENNFEIDTISKNKNFNSTISDIRDLVVLKGNETHYPNFIKHTENMYNQLFPDYAEIPTEIDNLVIIPNDSLSLIPFEVLLTEKYTGHSDNISEYPFLLKKYAIQYSPSVSMYYQLQKEKESAKYDIVILAPVFNGNDSIIVTKSDRLQEIEQNHVLRSFDEQGFLDGNGNITYLKHSETEANKIFKIFKKRISMKRLHRGANEYFVKSDTLSQYRIIHFATHAKSNTDKSYLSGIILSQDTIGGEDGFLYSNEIYGLNLNSELVCLSACETATGKVQNGEGVMDLSRAFFFAGTQNVIATLWKVEDESTSNIMTDFYKNYDNKNKKFAYALQKAKLDMLKSDDHKHPFYWAPFVLIGK